MSEQRPLHGENREREADSALNAVYDWFMTFDELPTRLGSILRRALDEVLDGARTSRWCVESLEKTEKTYIGTKVEILLKFELGMEDGKLLDALIQGHEVDIKWTKKRNAWMIPKEAIGQICLLVHGDDSKGRFEVGLMRTSQGVLNSGKNQDGKTTIKAESVANILWVVKDGTLPPNFLSTIPSVARNKIMAHRSGQARVNELFRLVQGRIINRNAMETVARQLDPMKRMRDARKQLAAEGILVLGHQDEDPETARSYGLPVPQKGEAISVRIDAHRR